MKTSEPGEPKFYNFIIIMFQRNILEEVFSFLFSQFSISSFLKSPDLVLVNDALMLVL